MANTKISALTSSTTPLAGTEVLPIVQSSATVKVSVANLTAGRAVSAASLALTTSPLPATSGGTGSSSAFTSNGVVYASSTTTLATGSTLVFNGTNLGIGTTPSVKLHASTSGAGIQEVEWLNNSQAVGANVGSAMVFTGTSSNNGLARISGAFTGATTADGAYMAFSTRAVTTGTLTEGMRLDATNNLTISNGNLIIGTSGKGIDFSATSGTGTSELLADYEEGEHTATILCSTSGTVTLNASYDTLSYTKIGRQVTVSGFLVVGSVASPVGFIRISLPFTIANLTDGAGDVAANVTLNDTVAAQISQFVAVGNEGNSYMRIYLGDATTLQSDAAQELKADTNIYVSITYFTS
jgi:hypothetical protein